MMLGFEKLGAISHSAESVIVKLRNETLVPTKAIMDLLLAVLDAIEAQAASARNGQDEPAGIEELIAVLDSVAKAPAASGTQAATPSAQTVASPVKPAVVAADPDVAGSTDIGYVTDTAADISVPVEYQGAADLQAPQPARSARQFSILVVDDDFVSRKMLAKFLEPYGSCDMAGDGLEAVAAFSDALAETPYDFVFLDIMLPGMDGYEVARQMRSIEMTAAMAAMKNKAVAGNQFNRDDTVIVMVSSLDDPESCFKACYRSGANTYIVKPADKSGIDKLMAKYLR
jgi:two-component system chemotaxis response regulator CheY